MLRPRDDNHGFADCLLTEQILPSGGGIHPRGLCVLLAAGTLLLGSGSHMVSKLITGQRVSGADPGHHQGFNLHVSDEDPYVTFSQAPGMMQL